MVDKSKATMCLASFGKGSRKKDRGLGTDLFPGQILHALMSVGMSSGASDSARITYIVLDAWVAYEQKSRPLHGRLFSVSGSVFLGPLMPHSPWQRPTPEPTTSGTGSQAATRPHASWQSLRLPLPRVGDVIVLRGGRYWHALILCRRHASRMRLSEVGWHCCSAISCLKS